MMNKKELSLQMEKFNLGLTRGEEVLLLDHQESWDEAFLFESERLSNALGDTVTKIHHVGSTSIPSICAKPILDLLVESSSVDALDLKKSTLENHGYEYKGEYGIPGRRYCVLYSEDKTKGFVHLHAYSKGHEEIKKHLIFRDYLRAHPQVAKEYEALKKDLARRVSRSDYSEAKNPLIQKILSEAFKFYS